MADNYLEKREEELRRGKPSVRMANPSLDTLITRISGHTEATDTSYVVKKRRQAPGRMLTAHRRSVCKHSGALPGTFHSRTEGAGYGTESGRIETLLPHRTKYPRNGYPDSVQVIIPAAPGIFQELF